LRKPPEELEKILRPGGSTNRSSFTLRLARSFKEASFVLEMEEEEVVDTSEDLVIRHLTFLMGESSLGDSKIGAGGVEVVAIVATSLVEVSSSSLSLLEYSS
jgi:hypothetical protein